MSLFISKSCVALADLQPGEAVGLRVVDGKRGRMAAHVTAWDAALKEDL
jgi:CspA family cold shock protein